MPPTLFVSHGAPDLALEAGPAHDFLRAFGRKLPRPKAVLAVSAHWETDRPTVGTSARPETIHDYHGFPQPLYNLLYPAPGAPEMAERAAGLLEAAGIACARDPARGLDHGAWVPLILMWPEADVPVAQLSISPGRGPQAHLALGRALAPLREEDVLVIGTGGVVHNLGRLDWSGAAPAEEWALAFDAWVAEMVAAGRADDLADFRRQAPHADLAQPSDEHFLPLLVAMGAAGPGAVGRRLHASYTYGNLAMTVFAFGE